MNIKYEVQNVITTPWFLWPFLQNCDLSGCDLQEANLRGSNVKGAIFEEMLTPLHMSQSVR